MKFTTQQLRDHSEDALTEHSQKNFIRKPHEWNCVFCMMFSIAVWHKTDVQICLPESYILPVESAIHGTGLINLCQKRLPRWQRLVFVRELFDKFFCSITLSWLKTLPKTYLLHYTSLFCLLLFTQQWRVNDVNIAGSLEQLFVPLCKKTLLLQNLISLFVVHTFMPTFVYSF